ncbi:glycosyltransferase family 2 protein [Roseovarius tibetensis]|uniref:glycosyltransferase family 2 protein n=1 Tax=Roseovarius tibetensis TaxID=2685897 RepID=UPI003D7F5F05
MSHDPRQAPEFSVIVISYNTRDMTLACLTSVYGQTRGDVEVVVVDNASTDGSAEAIRAQFPQVRLIAENVNHGFAAAHHVAVPHCRAPWLLLLNPDTVVLDSALDKLMTFRRARPEAGIWGGRTVFADGSLNPASCWRRQTLWSLFCRASGLATVFRRSDLFNPEAYGGWPRDTVREVDIVTGCFLLISRKTWDRLGGFDPVFVMYGEEADMCLRARKIGLHPMITPEATIIHYGGASEKVRADKLVRLLRAKAELVKRHFAPGTRAPGLVLLAAWPASRLLALSVLSALSARARFRDSVTAWRTVWQRRGEWRHGF